MKLIINQKSKDVFVRWHKVPYIGKLTNELRSREQSRASVLAAAGTKTRGVAKLVPLGKTV